MHQIDDTDWLSKLYEELSNLPESDDAEYCIYGPSFDFIQNTAVGAENNKLSNGCTCNHCGEIFPYAEPNQKDNGFKCWSCRNF
jgi:hypothetical protein